jgi:beta-glucosidase
LPGKTVNNSNGDVADNHYNLFLDDVKIMCDLGLKSYRFSISWSRVLRIDGTPNEVGIAFYHKVLDALNACNIVPFVTLYHWDLPQQYNEAPFDGWLSSSIIAEYVKFADVCFSRFGSRIRHWITFNEPMSFCLIGYGMGVHAPGRCSDRSICPQGDSSTEPYLCSHNVLLSHGKTVQLFNNKYRNTATASTIMMTINSNAGYPYNSTNHADIEAVERFLQFQISWYADPIFKGDYPNLMKQLVGDRLPSFSQEEKGIFLSNRPDAFGLNFYTCSFCQHTDATPGKPSTWSTDSLVNQLNVNATGDVIGPPAASDWLFVCPQGFAPLLQWIHKRYGKDVPSSIPTSTRSVNISRNTTSKPLHSPSSHLDGSINSRSESFLPIFVTENGVDVPNEDITPLPQVLNDQFRINYFSSYLASMEEAMAQGVPIKGYFAWSLLDNFEWADGYSKRFGMTYVDYSSQLRYIKQSGLWYAEKIKLEAEKADYCKRLWQQRNASGNKRESCSFNTRGRH